MKKKALILGITGQDGSYMLELLIKKKYEIHGLIRKSATGNTKNIDHIIKNKKIFSKRFFLHKGDLLDMGSIGSVIKKTNPDEIYNFADQDHVKWSFEIPSYSFGITGSAVINILEIIRNSSPKSKYFQPYSSIHSAQENYCRVDRYRRFYDFSVSKLSCLTLLCCFVNIAVNRKEMIPI